MYADTKILDISAEYRKCLEQGGTVFKYTYTINAKVVQRVSSAEKMGGVQKAIGK